MHSQYSVSPQGRTMQYNNGDWPTPVVEFSEGIRPSGQFMPHPSLPLGRSKGTEMQTNVVISTGKVVALSSDGFLVPAGLLLDTDAVYTQLDVDEGVLTPAGKAVVAGDKVADKFTAANVTVSDPVGVASYDFLRHPGGDGVNPIHFNYINYNIQHKVAFTTDYVLELPLVESDDEYAKAPMKGVAAFVAAKGTTGTGLTKFTAVKPGDFVTFDKNSNFVVDAKPSYGKTIGQVIQIVEPKDMALLGLVRTSNNGGGALNAMPGTATNGLPEKITYANGYGLVRVNMINR